MDGCCEIPKPSEAEKSRCPRCSSIGLVVAEKTVRAILKPDAEPALIATLTRFCRTRTCDVLYYSPDGAFVEKGAATVRVGVKETADPIPLCYCFGFTRADVRQEVEQTGTATIPARITAEVKAGRCACEVKNPSGRCCLGEVNKAVKEAKDRAVNPDVLDSGRVPAS